MDADIWMKIFITLLRGRMGNISCSFITWTVELKNIISNPITTKWWNWSLRFLSTIMKCSAFVNSLRSCTNHAFHRVPKMVKTVQIESESLPKCRKYLSTRPMFNLPFGSISIFRTSKKFYNILFLKIRYVFFSFLIFPCAERNVPARKGCSHKYFVIVSIFIF